MPRQEESDGKEAGRQGSEGGNAEGRTRIRAQRAV
jgi:hypothetical protein